MSANINKYRLVARVQRYLKSGSQDLFFKYFFKYLRTPYEITPGDIYIDESGVYILGRVGAFKYNLFDVNTGIPRFRTFTTIKPIRKTKLMRLKFDE